ncbi:MAK10-like protein [Tanacetum coccineum]
MAESDKGKFVDDYSQNGKSMMLVDDDIHYKKVTLLIDKILEQAHKVLQKQMAEFKKGKSIMDVEDDMYWNKVTLTKEIRKHAQKHNQSIHNTGLDTIPSRAGRPRARSVPKKIRVSLLPTEVVSKTKTFNALNKKHLQQIAFKKLLEEIYVTWTQFGKKQDKITTLHEVVLSMRVLCLSRFLMTSSELTSDGVRLYVTASELNRLKETLRRFDEAMMSVHLFFMLFVSKSFSLTSMENENPIHTLGDYSIPSHEGYRNTIKLLDGNNVVPLRSNTIRLVKNECSFHRLRSEDPNQHLKDFLKLVDSLNLDVANMERTRLHLFQFSLRDQASNWLERLPAGSISTWEDLTTHLLAQFFPPVRTGKLRNDILMFQQHQGESLSEAWTRFKDLLHHGIDLWLQNTEESWELLEDLALYDNESWNDPRDFAKLVKAISLPQDVLDEAGGEMTNKIDTFLKAINDQMAGALPSDTVKNLDNSSSPKHIHFVNTITILSKEDEPMEKEIMKRDTKDNDHETTVKVEEKRGSPSNFKIPCNIGHVHIEKAYIDLNSPKNVMTRMQYNWIIRKQLKPREDPEGIRGISNFTGRIRGMHIFVGNFTYVSDFMIVEDISSIIDPRLSQVVLGKPFVEVSNMTHDSSVGVVKFTIRDDEIAYKMPHKIEQYNSLLNLEKSIQNQSTLGTRRKREEE